MKRRDFLRSSAAAIFLVALGGKLKAASSPHYVLNETAARVLQLLKEGFSVEAIARKLVEEYEVDYSTAYGDILVFLKEAKRVGIV
ncbi:MAG: PqqD family protein [Thermotogae bacterium]|nr:PqqD family protein [Thermotogota bacterium]